MEETIVEEINQQDYHEIAKKDPDMTIKIIDSEIKSLRRLSEEYSEACQTIASYVQTHSDEKKIDLNDWKKLKIINKRMNYDVMKEKQYFDQGDIIMKAGALENWMYLVVSGSVGIFAEYDQSPRLLTTLSRSDIFGEMGMIENKPRSATAVAMSEVTLDRFDEEDYITALKDDPNLVNALLESISNRIAILSKDYVEACELISECVRLDEAGEPKPKELTKKMKRIIEVCERK